MLQKQRSILGYGVHGNYIAVASAGLAVRKTPPATPDLNCFISAPKTVKFRH